MNLRCFNRNPPPCRDDGFLLALDFTTTVLQPFCTYHRLSADIFENLRSPPCLITSVGGIPVRREGDGDVVVARPGDPEHDFDKGIEAVLPLFFKIRPYVVREFVHPGVVAAVLFQEILYPAVPVGGLFVEKFPLALRGEFGKAYDHFGGGLSGVDVEDVARELVGLLLPLQGKYRQQTHTKEP